MRKSLVLFLTVIIMVASLSGCMGDSKDENVSAGGNFEKEGVVVNTFGLEPLAERTTVTVGFFSGSTHSSPFYIADKMGFFDELNIDLEYETFINGPAMMEASSNWDICDVGGPGILNGMKNYDVRMVGVCDYEYNLGVFARPDSEIAKDPKNPEVWKGKKVILPTGTVLQVIMLRYLESMGLGQDDIKIISMDVTSGLTAFKAGEGDIYCGWNAFAFIAEDEGYIRITDGGQMGLQNVSGLGATIDAMNNNKEGLEAAWMLYYLTWQWAQESDENMDKAIKLFVESCEDEGVLADENICRRELDIFACPSPIEAVKLFTTEENDVMNKAERKVLIAENNLFEILDFFISTGSYTEEDRNYILDNNLVDPSIAKSAKLKLEAAGQF